MSGDCQFQTNNLASAERICGMWHSGPCCHPSRYIVDLRDAKIAHLTAALAQQESIIEDMVVKHDAALATIAEHLDGFACFAAHLKNIPTDRSALDRMLAEAREQGTMECDADHWSAADRDELIGLAKAAGRREGAEAALRWAWTDAELGSPSDAYVAKCLAALGFK